MLLCVYLQQDFIPCLMKYMLLPLVLCVSLLAAAQTTHTPFLVVVGNAKTEVTPDIGVLNIRVSTINATMSEATKALGEKTRYYTQQLMQLGFKEGDIKTTGFSVSKNRVYLPQGGYKDSGYIASQNVRLEFGNDKETISQILNKFSESTAEVDFSFDFKVSDKRRSEVQNDLIRLAVKDAQQKAGVMAQAAGVKLARVHKMHHGQERAIPLEEMGRGYKFSAMAADNAEAFYFTPDDIVFSDSVTMEWVIE